MVRRMKTEFDDDMDTAPRNSAIGKSFRGKKVEKKASQAEQTVLAGKGV